MNTPVLEPTARELCEATAGPPYLCELEPEEARRAFERRHRVASPRAAVEVEDLAIPGGPAGRVVVRVLRPRGVTAALPVILFLHGAGWVLGGPRTHDRLARELAAGTRAALVLPDYALSPEATYPTALEQAYAVLCWIARDGARRRLDGDRIALAGDAAGGNLCAALTLLVKQRVGPPLAGQALFSPITDASFDTPSYSQFAEGHYLRRDHMRWLWDQYTCDPDERAEVTASPLRATIDQLVGLPPALVVTAEAEVLRDEGEAYAAKLRAAGVPVSAVRYLGTIHQFAVLDPLRNTPAARAATGQAIAFLAAALGAGDGRSPTDWRP